MPGMQPEPRYDVFISYRRRTDYELALLLQRELKLHGYSAFLDRELTRGVFDDMLLRHIAESPTFLIILSPNALDGCRNENDWLRKEIIQAISAKSNIIPLQVDSFQFTPELVKQLDPAIRELARYQAIVYSREYFEPTVERIAKSIKDDKAERTAAAQAAEKEGRRAPERMAPIMEAQSATGPSPSPQPGLAIAKERPQASVPVTTTPSAPAAVLTSPAVVERQADRSTPMDSTRSLHSKKLLFGIASTAAVATLVSVLYVALHEQPKSPPGSATVQSHPENPTAVPSMLASAMGKLTIRTNVNDTDILVDGVFKTGTGGREQTIPVVAGTHKITVKAQGYDTPPEQQVEISKDSISTLKFALTKAAGNVNEPELDTYLILKSTAGAKVRIDGNNAGEVQPDGSFSWKTNPGTHQIELTLNGYQPLQRSLSVKASNRRPIDIPLVPKPALAVVSFEITPLSIQEGESVELRWKTKNATGVTIDGLGEFPPNSSTRVTPKGTGTATYILHTTGEGTPAQKTAIVNIGAIPKPAISVFTAGPETIQAGKSSKLVWATRNADGVTISSDNGPVGSFGPNGQHSVTPNKTTKYTLTANGHGKASDPQFATVTVAPVPLVATSPTRAPPVTQPAVPSVDSESDAVLATMHNYQEAFERMDIGALRKVFPQMPPASLTELQKTFKTVRAIKLNMTCKDVIITSDSAECTCNESPRYMTDGGLQHMGPLNVTFYLKKTNGTWYIESIK